MPQFSILWQITTLLVMGYNYKLLPVTNSYIIIPSEKISALVKSGTASLISLRSSGAI